MVWKWKSQIKVAFSQRGYAESLLEHFGMEESKEKATPMEPNFNLMKDEGQSLKNGMKF